MVKIKVNKEEAARRQIDAAIRMLFENEDPIAIHTITMAGFRILRDLTASRDDSYMHKMAQSIIKPGMEGKFWGAMNSFSNFLKHAETDSDEIFDNVQEEVNDVTLVIAALYYQDLGHQFTPEMLTITGWHSIIHPEHIRDDASYSFKQLASNLNKTLIGKSRIEQLAIGKEVLGLVRNGRKF